jgi:hypothetical protein
LSYHMPAWVSFRFSCMRPTVDIESCSQIFGYKNTLLPELPSDYRIQGQKWTKDHFRISDSQDSTEPHLGGACFPPIFVYRAKANEESCPNFGWATNAAPLFPCASFQFSDMRSKWKRARGVISEFRMRKDGCCTTLPGRVPSDFRV